MIKKISFILGICFLLIACSHKPNANLKQTELSKYVGHWVVVNYWASWCQPCVAEIPELNRFHDKNHKQSVELFGVNADNLSADEQAGFATQLNIRYPLLLTDPLSKLKLNVMVLPTTFIFSPRGELVQVLQGPQSLASLETVLSRAKSQFKD